VKVVLVVPAFPKRSETFIVNKFIGLLERGFDAHVVCNRIEEDDRRLFPELSGTAISRRIHPAWPTASRWRAAAGFPRALTTAAIRQPATLSRYLRTVAPRFGADSIRRAYLDARLIELAPDLVHFEFGTLSLGRMYLRGALGCPVMVSFRGYDINFVGLEEVDFYRTVWEGADLIHFLGSDLWKRAVRRGCPPEKPHVFIPPAIDTGFFDPGIHTRGVDPRRDLEILSVGRLVPKKGYEYALSAVAELVERGVRCRYTIIGDGAYLEALTFARHQLGLDGVVQFVGAATRSQVRALMLASDVFLHAAVSEGFCNAVLEAQAMQLPVVCSDADGLPENVRDGETGFVVPRRDSRVLAEKLLTLAETPELRRRFGTAGRRRVTKHFRLQDQIDAWEAVYLSLLNRRTAPGSGSHTPAAKQVRSEVIAS
jgi:colanic acid/amylovoran biosynthesis glycosyltransferase